jgi:hypothetical protein
MATGRIRSILDLPLNSLVPLTLVPLACHLAPMHTADEVAELAMAMAKIPDGTPSRAQRIWKDLTFAARCTAERVERMLMQLSTHGKNFVAFAQAGVIHAHGDTIILVPSVDSCVACGHSILTDARRGHRPRKMGEPNHPTVYCERGVLHGELYIKTCASCGAAHTLTYAEGGTRIEAGKVLPYADATIRRWYQSTRCTIFETSLLRRVETQALHSHTGWETFGEEYRDLTGCDNLTDRFRKTLAHAWLSWSLLRWRDELDLPSIPMKLTSDEGLDETLLEAVNGEGAADAAYAAASVTPTSDGAAAGVLAAASDTSSSLLYRFIDKWGRRHAQHCRRPLPGQTWCMCYIIDGGLPPSHDGTPSCHTVKPTFTLRWDHCTAHVRMVTLTQAT